MIAKICAIFPISWSASKLMIRFGTTMVAAAAPIEEYPLSSDPDRVIKIQHNKPSAYFIITDNFYWHYN